MKRLKSIVLLLLIIAVVVFGVMAGVHYHKLSCEEVSVVVVSPSGNSPFTSHKAEKLIAKSGSNPVGQRMSKVNREALAAALQRDPWFDHIESTAAEGGKLVLTVAAKSPVAWVFPNDGSEPLILTDNGQLLPDDSTCQRLPVISGNIAADSKVKKATPFYEAYLTARAIAADSTYSAQYPQIFVRDDGQIELYSVLGDHTVLIGDASDIGDKLANLDAAYTNGILATNTYKSLDLRFHNRVYATKNETN
jgi:cell division protein FtsQ